MTNITSLNALNNGGSVVNNVFEVQDESNSYANDADVTLTTANNFWMMPDVKGDSEKRIKQIQVQSGDYQVSDIPDNIDWAFRPYAAVDEYPGKTAGAYASLLPKNYQKYVVFDVKQKSGFPYGATLTKSVAVEPEFTEGYILQYHADKTTEVVALITTDKVTAVEGSVLKEITAADGVYQLGVDTSNGENEPVVLAFYTGAPEVGFTMKVTGNIDEESGYLLTDTDRELRVVLNGGIGTNYFNDASGENINFALDNSKSSMPDGEKITLEVDEDNENIATIHVPAGTSGSFTLTGFYQAKEGKTISGNSAGKNVQTASVTVKMVGVQNVEADGVPYSALGSKYYGELTFVVNKDTV